MRVWPLIREAARAARRGQADLPFWAGTTALLVAAATAPLNLAASGEAPFVSDAMALGGPLGPDAAAPLALLAARLAGLLPVGGWALRAHLAGAVAMALTVALVAVLLRGMLPPLLSAARARAPGGAAAAPSPAGPAYAFVVLLGVVAVVLLAPPLAAGSHGSVVAAFTAAAVAGGLVLQIRLMNNPGHRPLGLTFSFFCGLASGVDPLASAILWPPAAVLWIISLRRGDRWALLAPLFFVAGAAVVLMLAAVPAEPRVTLGLVFDRLTLGGLRSALVAADGIRAWALIESYAQDVGVVAALLVIVGLGALAWRAPTMCGVSVFALWAALITGAALPAGDPRIAIGNALLVVVSAPALLGGVVHLSARLGRGGTPAALAIATIAAVPPALTGGEARWQSQPSVAMALMDRVLAEAPLRARVDPGSSQVEGLLRLGATIGLRPDLAPSGARAARPAAHRTARPSQRARAERSAPVQRVARKAAARPKRRLARKRHNRREGATRH